MRLTLHQAKQIIDAQAGVSAGARQSAWLLFQILVQRIDPETGRPFTARRALQSVLRWIAGQRARERAVHLTPAELRILKLLVEGLTLKQIALEIGVSFETVKRHTRKVRYKTGSETLYQAIAVVVDQGWVRTPRSKD